MGYGESDKLKEVWSLLKKHEDKVYIMERIVPAHTLYESAPRNERIKIAGEIFKGLHKTDLPIVRFLLIPNG